MPRRVPEPWQSLAQAQESEGFTGGSCRGQGIKTCQRITSSKKHFPWVSSFHEYPGALSHRGEAQPPLTPS